MVTKQPWFFCTLAVALVLCLPATARAQSRTSGSISGIITEAESEERLAGVTIVAVLAKTEFATISDESGAFRFDLPPGDWRLKFVFAEIATAMQVTVVSGQEVSVRPKIDLSFIGCSGIFNFGPEKIDIDTDESGIRERIITDSIKKTPPPTFSGTHFPTFFHQSPLEGLTLVPGWGTLGSPWVTRVNREFVRERSVTRVGVGPQGRSSLGAIEQITLKRGRNQLAGSILGQTAHSQRGHSYALGTHLGGPIKSDKAWFFVGGAAALDSQQPTRSGALSHQALVRLDYAASPDGGGSLNYLTTVHNKGQTDNIGAEWTEMFSGYSDKLSVGAALQQGHRLNRQDRRLSARVSWLQRLGELDHHELTTGARVEVDRLKGLKTLNSSDHTFDSDVHGRNVAIYMQERWTAQRNITLNASLQYEHSSVERALRLRTSSRFEPRLGIAYDPTDEHRSKLFANVSRLHPRYRLTTSEQDQGFADEAVVGAEYELRNYYVVGANYQGRRSLVPEYHLDAATIHVFRGWSSDFRFRASYSYAKTKATKGTSSQIGSHRFRLDGYRLWDIGSVSKLYLGWSLRAADKGYRDANLRIGLKRTISSDHTIDVFTDIASTRLSGPASLLADTSEATRDGSKLQLSVRYSY